MMSTPTEIKLRTLLNELLNQIDINDFGDSHGHQAKMLKAVHDAMRFLIDNPALSTVSPNNTGESNHAAIQAALTAASKAGRLATVPKADTCLRSIEIVRAEQANKDHPL